MVRPRSPAQVLRQRYAPPESQLAVMAEETSYCVNDLIGACIGLHLDPERSSKITRLHEVQVCASPLGSLDQFSRPLKIFSRLPLELTQYPVEHFSEAFSEMTRCSIRRAAGRKPPLASGLANVSGHWPQTLPLSWLARRQSTDHRAARHCSACRAGSPRVRA